MARVKNGTTLLQRFESKIFYSPDGCHYWIGFTNADGYGLIAIDNKDVSAHRVSYKLYRGDPGELCVCHTCDNPLCVNPNHLFLGTHQDNMADKMRKGRHRNGIEGKITVNEVREIRKLINPNATRIAPKYGVVESTIHRIIRRKTWTWVV